MNLQINVKFSTLAKNFKVLAAIGISLFLFTISGYAQSGSGEGKKSTSTSKVKTRTKQQTKTETRTISSVKKTIVSKVLKVRVTALRANFRIYPGNDAQSLGWVVYGDLLIVIDKNHVNGWYNVKHAETNITGWVYGNTIKFVK